MIISISVSTNLFNRDFLKEFKLFLDFTAVRMVIPYFCPPEAKACAKISKRFVRQVFSTTISWYSHVN